jgi:hypothetical protein
MEKNLVESVKWTVHGLYLCPLVVKAEDPHDAVRKCIEGLGVGVGSSSRQISFVIHEIGKDDYGNNYVQVHVVPSKRRVRY